MALPPSFKRMASHYYPGIPTFRLGTLNHGTGGLGALLTDGERYRMTRRNLSSLMAKCDIVLTQETKYQTPSYLKSYPGWKAFRTKALKKPYKPGDEKKEYYKVGGIIWVRRTLLVNFDIEPVEVEPGYVHYVCCAQRTLSIFDFPCLLRPAPL
mgnify:CR=1 FL=1